ncbi:MAG: hypothetical protein JEY71_15020 [Sphaerochaeta sp.]|nr:hypothetical protein [Sphaerochaeta sp.]
MKHTTAIIIVLIALSLSCALPLFSAELTYDMATGKITGFDLSNATSYNTPSSYENSTEVWMQDGFVGRLNYRGDPTTLTFSNTGDNATGSSNNRFYFTYDTNGVIKLNRWREFFLVTRVKGLYHNGTQHDFSGINTVVAHDGDPVAITQGAGPELVAPGQSGYNTSGISGTYNGSNTFKYKYKYQYIWVDVTVIQTSQKRNLFKGYYKTQFTANSTTGVNYTMILVGERDPRNNQTEPSAFYFGVESIIANPFPFEELFSKNTLGNSLFLGRLRYFSLDDSATVRFSSDFGGSLTTFTLQSAGAPPVPYSLVFDPTAPNTSAVQITSSSTIFYSAYLPTISPIDGSSTEGNVLEGDLRIFIAPYTHPLSGTYTSTIYCILTQI